MAASEGSTCPKSVFVPNDWDDEERMNFMFSVFPKNRDVNPKHWDSKLGYWLEEAKKCCGFHKDICLSCEVLRERFRRGDRTPRGFQIIFNEMIRQRMLIEPEKILSYLDGSWLTWGSRVLTDSVKWLWKSDHISSSLDEKKEFIFYENLLNSAMDLLSKHHKTAKVDGTDHAVPWNVVKELYTVENKKLTDQELLYAIAVLKSKGLADLATNNNNEKLVKFAKSTSAKVVAIGNDDWDVVRLKKAIAKLKIEIAEHQKEINNVKIAAHNCVKTNNKMQAKRLVAQKRKLEKTMNVKQDSLMALTDHLSTIRNSESTRMIVEALNSSSSLLNNSLREEGLSVEKIDKVFERNFEANDMVKEIDETIFQGIHQLQDDVDLDELEKEFAELMSEKDDVGSPEIADVMNLPSVPVHSPMKGNKQTTIQKPAKVLAT
eukprot:gene5316-5985_t